MSRRLEKQEKCSDCQVGIGQPHEEGCDWARCMVSGQQRIQCELYGQPGYDCGTDVFDGWYPGTAECIEWGWYSFFRPPMLGEQYGEHVRCGPDVPTAGPNLNRLAEQEECRWAPELGRWVLGTDRPVAEHVPGPPITEQDVLEVLSQVCAGSAAAQVARTLITALAAIEPPEIGDDLDDDSAVGGFELAMDDVRRVMIAWLRERPVFEPEPQCRNGGGETGDCGGPDCGPCSRQYRSA